MLTGVSIPFCWIQPNLYHNLALMRLDFCCCSCWSIGFVLGLSDLKDSAVLTIACKAWQLCILSAKLRIWQLWLLRCGWLLAYWQEPIVSFMTLDWNTSYWLFSGLVCCYSWCLHFWLDCSHLLGRCWVSDQNWLHTNFYTNIYSVIRLCQNFHECHTLDKTVTNLAESLTRHQNCPLNIIYHRYIINDHM